MTSGLSDCTPFCRSFRCDKRPSALKILRKGGKKVIWCTWVDDECDGPWCQFGVCKELKMTPDGKCKKSIKTPKPRIRVEPEDFVDPEEIPERLAKKIRIRER